MGELNARRDYIPLTRCELIELLCSDRHLTAPEHDLFRNFCELVTGIHHMEFNGQLQNLKRAYAPFDPDTDTAELIHLTDAQKQTRINSLYREFAELLEMAHFQHLNRRDIEPVLRSASDWGIRMEVDFNLFEYIAIFARGDAYQKRTRRRLWNFYRLEETEAPIYRRLVLILKLRSKHVGTTGALTQRRLQGPIDSENVFLKIFKDIPKLDVMMLLPGARVRMSKVDRGKIGLPILSGVAILLWNLLRELTETLQRVLLSPNALWGVAVGGLTYGYKSYYGYLQTRQAYHLTLTQSLYFQNLDSNAGVLTRLVDEAEEQMCRVTILAYYCLYRYAGEDGWTSQELDLGMDLYLDRCADLDFDCTGLDALDALRKLGLVQAVDEQHYRALPPAEAIHALQKTWQQRIAPPTVACVGNG
jgi:Protein of unknown function (DUF3754)